MPKIMVDKKSLQNFIKVFSLAASEYKSGYDKLSNLIDEATSTGVRGDAALKLRELYDRKKPIFDAIYKEVNKAQGYAEHQLSQFNRTMNRIDSEFQ